MKNTNIKHHLQIFGFAFLQVFLVACNTWQIAREYEFGAGIVGFLISYVWTFNVKKLAVSTMSDRLIYACGAGLGTVAGMKTAKQLYLLF